MTEARLTSKKTLEIRLKICHSWVMAKDVFNAAAVKRQLDRLQKNGSAEQHYNELRKPWPDMQSDVRVAYAELAFEIRKNRTAPLFLKSVRFEGDNFHYKLPDWFRETRRRFSELYQAPEDEVRFIKTITVFQDRLMSLYEGKSEIADHELTEALAELSESVEASAGTA